MLTPLAPVFLDVLDADALEAEPVSQHPLHRPEAQGDPLPPGVFVPDHQHQEAPRLQQGGEVRHHLLEGRVERLLRRGVGEIPWVLAESDDVVVGRMQDQELSAREPPARHHLPHPFHRGGIGAVPDQDLGLDPVRVALQTDPPAGPFGHPGDQLHPDGVAAQTLGLDESGAQAHEGIQDQLPPPGEAAHGLIGDLRDEVPPVFRGVHAVVRSGPQQPQAVREDVLVFLPAIQVQVVDRRTSGHGPLPA